jgi:hypothetical protein
VDRLGLVYGAIDMRLTPDGRYVFLEVNPSGLWLFVEEPTGLPITDAVVDWFVAHDEAVTGDGDADEAGSETGSPEDEERADTERARRRERTRAERRRRRAAERRERREE